MNWDSMICRVMYGSGVGIGMESYSDTSLKDPHGPDSGNARVLRGGSWIDNADYCRVANRDYGHLPG